MTRRLTAHLSAAASALALMAAVLVPATAGAAGPAPAPAWGFTMVSSPTNFDPANTVTNSYVITARNMGAAPAEGDLELVDRLPTGMKVSTDPEIFFTRLRAFTDQENVASEEACKESEPGVVVCKLENTFVPPGQAVNMVVPIAANPSLLGTTVTNEATVSGGGPPEATATAETTISASLAPRGFPKGGSENWLTDAAGGPETQAGGHPQTYHFGLQLNTYSKQFTIRPIGALKTTRAKLPHGLVINPRATPVRCSQAQLEKDTCPDASAVGVAHSYVGLLEFISRDDAEPIYNMKPQPGEAASLAFQPFKLGIFIHLHGGVDTAGDYTITAEGNNIPEFGSITGIGLELWGDPSDPSHDYRRGECGYPGGSTNTCPVALSETPFVSMPSACSGPLVTHVERDSWEEPGVFDSVDIPASDLSGNPVGVAGCNALEFEPTLRARPTTNVADSPSGLEASIHVPQTENVNTLSAANLKDATVTLPPGLVVNPATGNGLGACSAAQIGLTSAVGATPVRTTADPATCPDNAKLGTVEITTPLLDHALPGSVYIAKPYENPFNSLLALYIAVDDPISGVVVKLAGQVSADPQTGQLTATFSENPELPVEDIALKINGGAAAPLRTPVACGNYSTTSSLTPWSAPESGPPDTPSDTWAIEQGANGHPCPTSEAAEPTTATLDAGTVSPIAGAYSPIVVNLRREDGTQQFSTVKLTPPPGLLGKLAGVPYCPDSALAAAAAKSGEAEAASPSCPAASQVGTVAVGAGAGPAPYYAHGKVYLTGPYKGAPISLAIVTPATAGPFDLGTVVVRTALQINPVTTQITAISDPLPSILKGIPLDIRSAQIKLDRPNFTLNPTSCDPTSFGGETTSLLSQVTSFSSRFQLGECGRLKFKPKLTLKLKGGTKRTDHPALTAILQPGAGANLASLSVALPHSEFLDQGHIGTICTRVQFAASQCPAASVYGEATVTTPLLDQPLTGPVYLRSSDNTLPDLVPDLRGPANQPIKLEADGRIDSIHGGIRNSFEFIPDAPFTKLVLKMRGGKKGLLVNSTDICKNVERATVKYIAHNGLAVAAHPPLQAQCKKGKSGKKGGKSGK
ncbi:MAG: hypothetical protein H0X42_05660 [Solirubrobacterales bacterium]|nr:hypothetical protein [Solirubrobacterales bacterium]